VVDPRQDYGYQWIRDLQQLLGQLDEMFVSGFVLMLIVYVLMLVFRGHP
jgi:hypothetical protein